jgi:IS5 family transposase
MLIQERVNEADVVLKVFVAIDDRWKALRAALEGQQLPRDARGGKPRLHASEVMTMLVLGALAGLTDKAKLSYLIRTHHGSAFPALVSYSKFVEASNRVGRELAAVVSEAIARNREANPYPVVFQDSTSVPVCKVVRAIAHKTFAKGARKSRNRSGWWYGFKLHLQCDEEGRVLGLRVTAGNVDDRRVLDQMTAWMASGILVGDAGYVSAAKAEELGARGVKLVTGIRKNMKKLATAFDLACLRARRRVEEVFGFLKCSFGLVRSTHRAPYALPIHLLACVLAYCLFKEFFA